MLVRRTIVRPLPSVLCAAAGGLLVAAAIWWPWWTDQSVGASGVRFAGDRSGGASWAPLAGAWDPRVGPGTVVAIVVAVAVIVLGPILARRVSWPALMLWTWVAATGWTVALAAVDGREGIGDLFTRKGSFLYNAERITSWREIFPNFVDRIPLHAPNNWEVHVSSHPPGALLAFVGFDRIGLSDTFWLGLTVLAIGTTAAVACCIALRRLAGDDWARQATPWLILAPAAIWIGVSPDALFAAAAAWAIALLALAATTAGKRSHAYAVAAGLAFGCCLYLSYGLVLLAPIALAVLIAARRWQPLLGVLLGIATVVAAVTLAGFAWWEAYPVLVDRYEAGISRRRPYDYWVWANLGAWTMTIGLAVCAALPLMVRALRRRDIALRSGAHVVALIGASTLFAVAVATLTGLSKSEVERIWLPFTWWALTIAVLLPPRTHRPLLALQAAGALAVQHLVLTQW